MYIREYLAGCKGGAGGQQGQRAPSPNIWGFLKYIKHLPVQPGGPSKSTCPPHKFLPDTP